MTKKLGTFMQENTKKLNEALNLTAMKLADETDGFYLPATMSGLVDKVRHVKEYYPIVISHRVGAEVSGLDWRGKND